MACYFKNLLDIVEEKHGRNIVDYMDAVISDLSCNIDSTRAVLSFTKNEIFITNMINVEVRINVILKKGRHGHLSFSSLYFSQWTSAT